MHNFNLFLDSEIKLLNNLYNDLEAENNANLKEIESCKTFENKKSIKIPKGAVLENKTLES